MRKEEKSTTQTESGKMRIQIIKRLRLKETPNNNHDNPQQNKTLKVHNNTNSVSSRHIIIIIVASGNSYDQGTSTIYLPNHNISTT